MANQRIKVDITPGAQPAPIVHCSQGDVGRQFEVQIYDGAAKYAIPSGTSIEVVGKKADKNIVEVTGGLSWGTDGLVTITTQEQLTACAGPVVCEIRVKQGNNVLGTANFILMCEGGTQDGPYSESVLPMLERAEHAAETVEADITRAETAATNAANSASAAANDASDAQAYAIQAQTAATNAGTSEENASRSAEEAHNSALAADSDAGTARNYAEASQRYAGNASQSESNAHQYETNAQEYATRANTSASAAASDADDAATAKNQAQTAANQARQYARPNIMETRVLAQDWDANTHKVTISDSSITLLAHVTVTVPEGDLMTESQWLANNAALANACIYPYSQSSGSITLYALNVPTTDVYVRLIISGGGVS